MTPRRGRNSEGTLSYHTTGVFLLPAALLLAPPLAVLVPIVQHVPEWLKKRQPWYIGTFNIFNYTLTILAALAVDRWVLARHSLLPNANLRIAIAGLVACIVYVVVNHALLAAMFRLGRGISVRESGLFTGESISAELVLAALGVGIATFWQTNPWLIPLALAPLVLINRSLSVPALQMEARVDPKTGLFNARHFAAALSDELTRAQRFNRPLSLMMADLDLLRDINNNYGHLAGDAVLRGIADVFREELRHYDIPARFGGEEFSILLPETTSEQAVEIAERIRRALAARRFDVETSNEPIQATVSIGIASFPADGKGPNELIHQADITVYRAKLQGRNRVLAASAESTLLAKSDRPQRLAFVPAEEEPPVAAHAPAVSPVARAAAPATAGPRPHSSREPRFFSLSFRLGALIALRQLVGCRRGHRRARARHEQRPPRAAGCCGDRGRRPGAGARGGRGSDLVQRGRRARGRGALRASRRAGARAHDGRGGLECSADGAEERPLQSRRADARVAGCGGRVRRRRQTGRSSSQVPAFSPARCSSPSTPVCARSRSPSR